MGFCEFGRVSYGRGIAPGLLFVYLFFFVPSLDSSAQLLGSMIEHNEFMKKLVFTCMLVSNKMAPNPTATSGTGY